MKIILPREVNTDDELRKRLANLVVSPQEREFQRYVSEGFDRETAADLSGLNEMSTEYRSSVLLRNSAIEPYVHGASDVSRTATTAVMSGVTSVGSAAGAKVGSAIGSAVMSHAVKNAQALSVVGTVIVGAGVAYASAKLVAGALGTGAAVATAASCTLASALVALSLFKRLG